MRWRSAGQAPFAVAVNTGLCPVSRYAAHALNEGDQVEVIPP
jgi:sulfur carrier protein